MTQILPIITVRGGSSVKDKNIRIYKGKPLLQNCVEKVVSVFGKAVVLSDTEKYSKFIGEGYDVQFVLDDVVADLQDVTVRLRKYINSIGYTGRVVLCQCTSPNIELETYQKILQYSDSLLDNEILITCTIVNQKPSAFFIQGNNGYLETAIKGMPVVTKPRQLLKKVFYYNGAITSFHSSQLKNDSFFDNSCIIPLVITEQEKLDIDREEDFRAK